jgi:hypothetical protein
MCNVEHQTLVDTVLEIIPLRRYKFTKNAIRLGGPVSDSATPCQMPNASRAVCGPSASWRPAAEYHHRRARTCVRQHAQQQSSSSSQRIIRTVDQPSAGVLPTPLSSARQPCKRAAALHVYNSSRAATVFCVSMIDELDRWADALLPPAARRRRRPCMQQRRPHACSSSLGRMHPRAPAAGLLIRWPTPPAPRRAMRRRPPPPPPSRARAPPPARV